MNGPESRTVTKKELIHRIAEQSGQTKVVVKDILQGFLEEIIRELSQGNRLEFREFGVFEVRERAPRRAQNPRTLEKVHVPAKRVVKFKVGRSMRERVCESEAPSPPVPDRQPAVNENSRRPRTVTPPEPPPSRPDSPF
jgi:integration host factor subunit beta